MDKCLIREYGYEYDAALNESIWRENKDKLTDDNLWEGLSLRSGRDALKVIAREYEPTYVLLPSLCCESMILPFIMYGHKIIFYKLTEKYKIDIKDVESILYNLKDKTLFLYMDYFGILSIDDDALRSLRKRYSRLVFIEDRTHNLIWESQRVFEADYVMASLRKWINIPDGGVLWSRRRLENEVLGEDILFAKTRLKAQIMRNSYLQNGDEELKTEYRKIFSNVSRIIDKEREPAKMSAYSYALVRQVDWNFVRDRRKKNSEKLSEILQKCDIKLIQKESGKSDLYVPFFITDREKKQSLLSDKGIFNTIIWPLSNEQKNVCPTAEYTEKYMLAAPCDQRYCENDMDFIGKEIKKVIYE